MNTSDWREYSKIGLFASHFMLGKKLPAVWRAMRLLCQYWRGYIRLSPLRFPEVLQFGRLFYQILRLHTSHRNFFLQLQILAVCNMVRARQSLTCWAGRSIRQCSPSLLLEFIVLSYDIMQAGHGILWREEGIILAFYINRADLKYKNTSGLAGSTLRHLDVIFMASTSPDIWNRSYKVTNFP